MTNPNFEFKPASDFIREDAPERYIYNMASDKHEIAISTHDLQVSYGDNLALSEGDLEFERYKITSLIGASGSGKSTFLRSLNRMNDDVATVNGQIMYRGVDINTKILMFMRCVVTLVWSFNDPIHLLNQFMTT